MHILLPQTHLVYASHCMSQFESSEAEGLSLQHLVRQQLKVKGKVVPVLN
jgi:hypothetical protein